MDEQQRDETVGATPAVSGSDGPATAPEAQATSAAPEPQMHAAPIAARASEAPGAPPVMPVAAGSVATATKPTVRRGLAIGAAGGALALGLLAGGVTAAAIAASQASSADSTTTSAQGASFVPPTATPPSADTPSYGTDPRGGTVPDTTTSAATAATADQQVGVVTINTTLGYQNASAAGTGMVLTSDGLVLTNNHVIEGSTAIQVTIESTGQTYTATVLGTDATHDVALLQLEGASGLSTVTLDNDSGVVAGDAITAVGNAEGGGDLLAAAGSVVATDQTMTASDGSSQGETLSGLIEFSAAVVPGDSGGPLFDSEGEVVGMTTAASSSTQVTTVAYAISIEDALVIAHQIDPGAASATVTIGYPAFLGVALASDSTATVAGVLDGTPAASAGLAVGDTITSVNGVAVASGSALSDALAQFAPGDSVALTWTTAGGTAGSATVTLIAGPAD
ncbi:trypsin-like peptidase domain-containing protein [Cellulomonas sp. ICMP 17802]|uniref:trypsin-like peptidase domain-containing protein n=1 Tax=Cellulomonas sp. ICMP 17802 TaxID=3239199 RepID=UPI00351B8567